MGSEWFPLFLRIFPLFLHIFPLSLGFSLLILKDKGKQQRFTAKMGNFTPTPSAPTPCKTSRIIIKPRSDEFWQMLRKMRQSFIVINFTAHAQSFAEATKASISKFGATLKQSHDTCKLRSGHFPKEPRSCFDPGDPHPMGLETNLASRWEGVKSSSPELPGKSPKEWPLSEGATELLRPWWPPPPWAWRQIWRVAGREWSQAPPSFWEVPGLPRKFFGDFPGSSLTVEPTSNQRLPGSFRNFPGSSQNFPGSSRTSPEVSPFLWEAWHPLLTHRNFLWQTPLTPTRFWAPLWPSLTWIWPTVDPRSP